MAQIDNTERLEIGARLRACREYLGYSQDEVADAIGIGRPAISLIETGQRKLEVLELKKFAALYGKSVDYFTADSGPEVESPAISALARAAKSLSNKDLSELQQFAEFLGSRASFPKE